MSEEPTPSRRGRAIGILKLLIAAALLAWVASSLPWEDELEWTDGEAIITVSGEILGDWRSEEIRFRPAPPDQELPPDFRDVAPGEALAVVRRPPDPPDGAPARGYDWRPSMPRVFLEMDPRGLAAALLLLLVGSLFGVTRWWRILALSGCPSTWWNTLRLTYLGFFFNLVVPGLTGGDIVKAVLVVREHPERRAVALVTVVLDRLIGLWALIALAAGVVFFAGPELAVLRWPVVLSFAAATVGLGLVLFPGPRRKMGLDALLERLPQTERLRRLERAASLFAQRKVELPLAVLLSFLNHLFIIAAVFAIGRAFGDVLSFPTYVAIVSVANVLSAIPITPGGWGVGEKAFGTLFVLMGADFALGVAVSVTYRLCNMGLGLLGGLFLLLPGGRRVRSEVREAGEVVAD